MTRLIDADALKKVWQEECGGECAICGYLITEKGKDGCNEWVGCDLIDNAPTVELQSCVAKVTLSEEQLNEIVARVTEKALSERLLRDV